MILDSSTGVRGILWNLDTGQPIPWVRWADVPATGEEIGTYEAFTMDPRVAKDQGRPLRSILVRRRARMRFQPTANLPAPEPPKAVTHGSKPRTVTRHQRLDVPLFNTRCDGPGKPPCNKRTCQHTAIYSTADEVQLEPAIIGRRRFQRGKMVRRWYWCEWCYQAPRILDARGEVIEVDNEVKTRPS
jgi:hypothetical protein